jgi:uncharacterized Ntn-hydrolase superfamily protein
MRFAIVIGSLILPSSALATYSVAATDSATKQVGGAITSCVGTLDVGVVYGGVPGHGVVHAQAALDPQHKGRDQAKVMLGMDADPAAIITAITMANFDNGYASRQYGIVDLMGRSKGFTGTQAQNYKEDRQGTLGTFTYSAQGNILTSKACLDNAEAGFKSNGCDLADRLMLAMEGGAMNGEGDNRCTPNGIPSNSAYIEVDEASGMAGSYLKLSVTNTSPMSAVKALRAQFDAWRMTHPCASMMPDAGPGDSGTMPMNDSGTTAPDAATGGDAGPVVPIQGGCSCNQSNASAPSGAVAIALLMFFRRRGRRRTGPSAR